MTGSLGNNLHIALTEIKSSKKRADIVANPSGSRLGNGLKVLCLNGVSFPSFEK